MQYTSLSLIVATVTTQCLNFAVSVPEKVLSFSPFFNSVEPLQALQEFLSFDK